MPYTLWSRNRLVGESALDYLANTARHRVGDFHPTEFGESIMPTLTGVREAVLELGRLTTGLRADAAIETSTGPDIRSSTEYADVAEAKAHLDALELELRGPDGSVIPTSSINIRDTQAVIDWSKRRARDGNEPHVGEIDEYDELLFPDDDDELMQSLEHDIAIIEEMLEKNAADARAAGHHVPSSREERPFPRYQIQVELRQRSNPDVE